MERSEPVWSAVSPAQRSRRMTRMLNIDTDGRLPVRSNAPSEWNGAICKGEMVQCIAIQSRERDNIDEEYDAQRECKEQGMVRCMDTSSSLNSPSRNSAMCDNTRAARAEKAKVWEPQWVWGDR